jgi:DNA-binding NtrC family response regulator
MSTSVHNTNNTKAKPLDSKTVELFKLIREAIFTNPFSDKQIEVELKITGLPIETTREERINKILGLVEKRINILKRQGKVKISDFAKGDRTLIKSVFLFDFFYRFRKMFDQIILDQMNTPISSPRIPFARDAISILQKRGFTKPESLHYFALSYQLRRAFFFIGHSLIGQSQVMKRLRHDLWNNVFTHNLDLYDRYLCHRMEDFSTMLLGETGTGKGTAAMAIGRSGFIPFDEHKEEFIESYKDSFFSLNLSQFPESLLESELFGHKKGAFTGAVEDYKGVFERCSPNGAILLDEIGEISIPVQIKLLQVLQERTFCSVGSHTKGRFQGRVIAATNRPIEDILDKGIFRSDFFYRLCTDIITVPPLRLRIKDDPSELTDLLNHTVEQMVGTPSLELSEIVLENIKINLGDDYPWPGNVRELEQCVRRVALKGSYKGNITPSKDKEFTALANEFQTGKLTASHLLSKYCQLHYNKTGTYEDVSKITGLDRRTVKKHINSIE